MSCEFFDLIEAGWKEGKRVCVGLDSVYIRIPRKYPEQVYGAITTFNHDLIRQTKAQALCYKLNLGAYLASGYQGIKALEDTCKYLRSHYPATPIIIDQKTGDIGPSNDWHAAFAFGACDAHAITVHNYTGQAAMQPLLDWKNKGIIVLCKTSNKGSDEIQKPEHLHTARYLFEFVARRVAEYWNTHGNCALVVGATYPEQMRAIREAAGDLWFLVPGVGTQGGDVEQVVHSGINSKGMGLIINSSSGIIFAADPQAELQKLTAQIDAALAQTLQKGSLVDKVV